MLCKLPKKLNEMSIKIGDNNSSFLNFWSDFEDKLYFLDVRGFIKLDFVKLTNDNYLIRLTTNFSNNVYLHMDTSQI